VNRMKHKSSSALTIIPILFALLMVFSFGCVKKEEKEIKIGAILPLTGDGAKYGIGAKEGIDLAITEINNAGGVLGKQLTVMYEDSKLNPSDGVSAITKMIDAQKLNIIIGDIGSSVTLAMAPIATKKNAILLSPASSNPKITGIGIFRVWPSDTVEGKVMAEFIKNKMKLDQIAIRPPNLNLCIYWPQASSFCH